MICQISKPLNVSVKDNSSTLFVRHKNFGNYPLTVGNFGEMSINFGGQIFRFGGNFSVAPTSELTRAKHGAFNLK